MARILIKLEKSDSHNHTRLEKKHQVCMATFLDKDSDKGRSCERGKIAWEDIMRASITFWRSGRMILIGKIPMASAEPLREAELDPERWDNKVSNKFWHLSLFLINASQKAFNAFTACKRMTAQKAKTGVTKAFVKRKKGYKNDSEEHIKGVLLV